MKLVLVGYMGSGKSVIAKKLSEKLQILYVELDELIEQRQKKSIKLIFEQDGELFFRKLEHQIFTEIVNSNSDLIVSTGGGTPCYFDNYKLLASKGVVSIYLKASVDTLTDRLILEQNNRPLLTNSNQIELRDFVAKHLFERSYYYHKAHFILNVDNKFIEAIAQEITELLT